MENYGHPSPSNTLDRYIDRTPVNLDPSAADLIGQSYSDSTRRAYDLDRKALQEWCSTRGVLAMPATPSTVVNYLGSMVGFLATATLERRVAMWSTWHEINRVTPNPVKDPLVRAALKGLRRSREKQREATPLTTDDLGRLLEVIPPVGLRNLRDRALLTVGFASGRRRSEIIGMDLEHLRPVVHERTGYTVTIPKSKTDQEGEGQTVWLRRTRRPTCPVTNLETWLRAADIRTGPLFRSVNRYGVLGDRLSDRTVNRIIATRAEEAELRPGLWSGHSLRAGFVTELARRGASTRSIARQTGHSPTSPVLHRYVRLANPWEDNAADLDGWV